MPRPPKEMKDSDDVILITAKVPKSLVKAVDEAVELGYFPSRSEAIREGLRRLLTSLLFTLEPVNVIEEMMKKNPPKNTMPPEVYFMKYALDYITENPVSENVFVDYTDFITKTTLLLKANRKDDVKKLITDIKKVVTE